MKFCHHFVKLNMVQVQPRKKKFSLLFGAIPLIDTTQITWDNLLGKQPSEDTVLHHNKICSLYRLGG